MLVPCYFHFVPRCISCHFTFTRVAFFSSDPTGSCFNLRLPGHPPRIILGRAGEFGGSKGEGRGRKDRVPSHLLKCGKTSTICMLSIHRVTSYWANEKGIDLPALDPISLSAVVLVSRSEQVSQPLLG